MKVSVIVSTYNSPQWLEKVLWGYSRQTCRDFELIVADDGSARETAELVDRMRAAAELNIRHVWQQDKGFRKCRILNKAVLHACSDYLVFTDGDCIPRQDFLAVHVQQAERGRFLSGGYYKLPLSLSEAISRDDILSGRCFRAGWLLANGLPPSYRILKLTAGYRLAGILNRITPTKCNFKGSNGSAWREDVLAVNGFNESMAWGGEDREFGVRLENSGIRAKHVRYNAIVLHLEHARHYRLAEEVTANKALRKQIEKDGITRTEHGIEQLLESGYETRDPEAMAEAFK